MRTSVRKPGVSKRELWSWAMFDFANSGYTTVVITAIFNAYFVSAVADGAQWATFAWTLSLSAAYAIVLLTAPLVGAFADQRGGKKRLLALTTVACVIGTAGLALVGPGDLAIAISFLILSNVAFGTGENLIAAFLPELANEKGLGRVSGLGWGLGYTGGLASLAACLAYVTWAQAQGLDANQFVPGTMLITALFFALASLPTFVWLKERASPVPESATGHESLATAWRRAFAETRATLMHTREFQDMRRLMLCIVFYQAGIQAVIALAAIYAQQAMGFSTQQTIGLIFVVNVTAAIGAVAFGYLQDRIGHVRGIALTLVGWIAMVAIAAAAESVEAFWVAANIAGLCLGASQSAGRAFIAYLAPEGRQGEFFGLWGLAVKLSSILGPLTYGSVTWMSGGNHRLAILITGSFFVVGLLILRGIDAERGHRAALAANDGLSAKG